MTSVSPPEDGRGKDDKRNAILTYREVNEILTSVVRMETKMDGVVEDLQAITKVHDDHEVRIRALELGFARVGGSTGAASYIWQAIWPTAAVIIAALAHWN